MPDVKDLEGLMVWLINLLAEEFGSHAILKGGMQLRLVDCPRYTNDLDYVFVPFSSKNQIKDRILAVLRRNPEFDVSFSINSKCIRYLVMFGGLKAQIEVNVAEDCESQELSTASLARAKNQLGRIIRVMSFNSALAHKLAAWNERGLIRDLYDAYYLAVALKAVPDLNVLRKRLSRVENREKGGKISAMSLNSFIKKLEKAVEILTPRLVEKELRDYMPADDLPGLDKKIMAGVRKIIDSIDRPRGVGKP